MESSRTSPNADWLVAVEALERAKAANSCLQAMTLHSQANLPINAVGWLANEICTELNKIEDWLVTRRTVSEPRPKREPLAPIAEEHEIALAEPH